MSWRRRAALAAVIATSVLGCSADQGGDVGTGGDASDDGAKDASKGDGGDDASIDGGDGAVGDGSGEASDTSGGSDGDDGSASDASDGSASDASETADGADGGGDTDFDSDAGET